jgi:hypothetical protein
MRGSGLRANILAPPLWKTKLVHYRSFGELEKVWDDVIGKFGNGLELTGGRKRLLCEGEWQERY